MEIRIIPAGDVSPAVLDGLADLLVDSVAGGASVGFLAALTQQEARDWWARTLRNSDAITWIAVGGGSGVGGDPGAGEVLGTVRLVPSPYPNSRHRADVTKFLVRRDARGKGYGRALMTALEARASELGRTLLLLDTETGSLAEGAYRRWGWQRYGVVDGHAATPDGQLAPTTFMFKRLKPRTP